MITVVVNFKITAGITREEIINKFEKTVAKWSSNPDLIRKSYLIDPDRGTAGGICLWKEKIHAKIWHGAEFRKTVKDNFGEEPVLQFYETPIVVDNLAGNIVKERDFIIK